MEATVRIHHRHFIITQPDRELILITARRYASAVYAVIVCLFVRPSVCLSVTSRSSTKTAKPRITDHTINTVQ